MGTEEGERERGRGGSCSFEAFVSRPVTRVRRIGEGRLAAREGGDDGGGGGGCGEGVAGRVATSDQ